MKFTTTVAVAAFVAVAAAQIDQVPSCAQPCLLTGIQATTCGADIKCACSDETFVQKTLACAKSSCSEADYQKGVAAAAGLCAQQGVTINTGAPAAGPSSTSEAAPESSSSEAAPTTSAPADTTSASVETTSASAPAGYTSASAPASTTVESTTLQTTTTAVVVPVPSSNGTASYSPPNPSTTGVSPPAATGAASSFGASGALAAVAAVAAFFL